MCREFPELRGRKQNAATDFVSLEQLIEWLVRTPSACRAAARSGICRVRHTSLLNPTIDRQMFHYRARCEGSSFAAWTYRHRRPFHRISVFSGAALILGHNVAAAALQERLQSQQITVHQLTDFASTDSLLQQLDDVWCT